MLPYISIVAVLALTLLGMMIYNLFADGKYEHAQAVIDKAMVGIPRDEWHR